MRRESMVEECDVAGNIMVRFSGGKPLTIGGQSRTRVGLGNELNREWVVGKNIIKFP